jgi:hypothetical protein
MEISAKLPASVAAGRQTTAFSNEITDAARCRGAATLVLPRSPMRNEKSWFVAGE